MRLWSLHPRYLDAKGLVAVWREGLLGRKVLLGKTEGYRNHPQLVRFRSAKNPADAINRYLFFIYKEAEKRGYDFDRSKIGKMSSRAKVPVTDGQLHFELTHLAKKLRKRDSKQFKKIFPLKDPAPHPLFTIVPGGIENWEKTS
jgi:hypothetical protein